MSLATKLALDAVILNIISSVCLVRGVERERSVRQKNVTKFEYCQE